MVSVTEVAAALRGVLACLDEAAVAVMRIASLFDELIDVWTTAVAESASTQVEPGTASWAAARDHAEALSDAIVAARSAVEEYLAALGVDSGDAAGAGTGPAPGSLGSTRDTAIHQARQRVGRGVPGSQTRGAWVRDDGGIEELRSGNDTEWFPAADRELRRLGGTRGVALSRLATHLEVQFVVRMRSERISDATLVLDRPPCGTPPRRPAPFTCDAQLGNLIRALLPAGSVLRVVDPDGGVWTYPKTKKD